ncbi:hypothetical protein [Gilvimarinus polysaccharolyticus]|uniref:hypothetical protein n=1 Tax=Gilvimarinus polysaccharolyticus TaxID=863921 RepID=UPI00067319F7|nr:hypothetical protein [Gilvimarinus polysaccharolyticus]
MFKLPLLLVCILAINTALAQTPLRDPTQPLWVKSAGAVDELALHSVLISASRKIAVINGITVREGESLPGGWQLQKIESSAVVISNRQQRRRLELAGHISGVVSVADKSAADTQEHIIQKQRCHNSTCTEVKQ